MVKKLLVSLLFITTCAISQELNIDVLLGKIKNENKHIMYFAHIPGCPYCKKMLDINFNDKEVKDLIEKNFTLVDVYTADRSTVKFGNFKGNKKKFAKHIGAFAYPATVYMDNSGKVVYRSIGYRNLGEYIVELNYIATKSYKTTDLDSFRENFEFERDD